MLVNKKTTLILLFSLTLCVLIQSRSGKNPKAPAHAKMHHDIPDKAHESEAFDTFLNEKYNNKMSGDKKQKRKANWSKNIERIRQEEEKILQNKLTFEVGVGPFTDLDDQERASLLIEPSRKQEIVQQFVTKVHEAQKKAKQTGRSFKRVHKHKHNKKAKVATHEKKSKKNLRPKNVRKLAENPLINHHSWFPAVENQQSCGSCVPFTVLGAFDANRAKTHNIKNLVLSKQHQVSCNSGNSGCNGGIHANAINFLMTKGAIKASDYPYVSGNDNITRDCDANKASSTVAARFVKESYEWCDSDFQQFCARDYSQHHRMLQKGPLAVYVFVEQAMYDYRSGVYDPTPNAKYDVSYCSKTNHAIILAGSGVDEKLGPYWLLRNSWSENYGENGYIRVKKNPGTFSYGVECAAYYYTGTKEAGDVSRDSSGSNTVIQGSTVISDTTGGSNYVQPTGSHIVAPNYDSNTKPEDTTTTTTTSTTTTESTEFDNNWDAFADDSIWAFSTNKNTSNDVQEEPQQVENEEDLDESDALLSMGFFDVEDTLCEEFETCDEDDDETAEMDNFDDYFGDDDFVYTDDQLNF